MKIRNGFISNSSSCSFLILKKFLSEDQIEKIKDHIKFSQNNYPQLEWATEENEWSITEKECSVEFYTCMDNFDMIEFLSLIGINEDIIEFF